MPNFAVASDAFKNTFRSWRLWLIQAIGTAALFGLFVLWLWIPVATALQLTLNVVTAALFLAATLILQAGTLRFFATVDSEEDSGSVAAAFRSAMRRLPAFAVGAALLAAAWYFAGTTDRYEDTLPNYLRSESPQFVRNLFSLHAYENLVEAGLFALQWIIAPALLLPFLASTASAGFSGFRRLGIVAWRTCVTNIFYWGVLAACAVIGVYASGKIMDWTPNFQTSTLRHESVSLLWRGTVAYFLILWAWLLACSMTGRLFGGPAGSGKDTAGQSAA
ncbi:MAG TPA: hypothetical protein VFP96_07080 [Candidatus Acidoferrum sp.]|nr:hypothetical protein [Candidatus Acidoferrum sp.]